MQSGFPKQAATIFFLVAAILACGAPGTSATTAPATSEPPHHVLIPGELPDKRASNAGDFDSSTSAKKKAAAGGDRFTYGRFERPFNANTMDTYFPNLDIIDTNVYQDDTWIYGTIELKDLGDSTSHYALEFDTNIDGKGDYLVMTTGSLTTTWVAEVTQVFQDANHDVGNKTAVMSDENATSGDGFETVLFDKGTGQDPDSAYARVSPTDANMVEIAVKRSVLGSPPKYLINMWAGNSILDPKLFDLNDHFTHTQAGAADPGFENFYPIKAVAEVDNSCRMAVGFVPTGTEPGLCESFIPNQPGVPPPGCSLNATKCGQAGMQFDATTCSCHVIP